MLYSWAAHSTCSRARSPRLLGGEWLWAKAHAKSPAITAGCSSQMFMLRGRWSAFLVLKHQFSTVFLLACWCYLLDLQAVIPYLAGSYTAIMLHALPPFPVVGFSGSRRCPAAVAAALSVVPQFSGLPAFVGCASGVDAAVSAALPSARVFRASSQHPAALAQRSAALVQAVAAGGGLLVVCPAAGQPCPAGVRPGAAFSGGGSGSWASCALAVQHGAAVLVWSSTLPAWLASAGYSPAPGWWYRPAAPAAPTLFG